MMDSDEMEGMGGVFQTAIRTLLPPRLGLLQIPAAYYGDAVPAYQCPHGCRWEWKRQGSMWAREACEHDAQPRGREAEPETPRTLGDVQEQRRQTVALLRDKSNLTARQRSQTLEAFIPYGGGWGPCLRLVRHCVTNLGVDSSFALCGPNGRGKSHMAAACANALLECCVPVYMSTTRDLFEALFRESLAQERGDYSGPGLWQKVKASRVLVLDDFGLDDPAPTEAVRLRQLLDHYSETRRTVILTTNLPPDEWGGKLVDSGRPGYHDKPARYKEAGPAIASRLMGLMQGRIAETPSGARCCRTEPVTEEERRRYPAPRLN